MESYSLDEIRTFVLNKMIENEIMPIPRDQFLIMDGEIHRYTIQGQKAGTKNGAYMIDTNGIPHGFIQDWSNPKVKSGFRMVGENMKAENLGYDPKKWDEEKKKTEAEREKKYLEAAEKAFHEFFREYVAGNFNHPYLTKKGLTNHYTIRLDRKNNKLAVPLFDINNTIISLQTIDADGNKRFYLGSKTKGAFFPLGLKELIEAKDTHTTILLAEGVATAITVYEVLERKYPVVAAMNCGNLLAVAKSLRTKFKNPFVIMADNDLATEKKNGNNPGIDAAMDVKKNNLALDILFPPFNIPEAGSDWNDYVSRYGSDNNTIKKLRERLVYLNLPPRERAEYDKRKKIKSLTRSLDPEISIKSQEYIGGMFPKGFLTIITAPSGTGKTIFTQKICSDLSIGGSFLDGFKDIEDEPVRKSLIFSGEAGIDLMIRRGKDFGWQVNSEFVTIADQFTFEMNGESLMFDEPEGFENVKRLIDDNNPEIVFVDSLRSFHNSDDSKQTEMKPMTRELAKIAREKNISIALIHHTRKRSAKDRIYDLTQDDVIGSSVLNQFVALIIALEPDREDKRKVKVKTLKSWGRYFDSFEFVIDEDLYGRSTLTFNYGIKDNESSRNAVWNYLFDTFGENKWFSAGDICLDDIGADITVWNFRRIIAKFLNEGRLIKRGATKNTEYALVRG